ncbi:MAG: hypothetical protein A3G76_13170 [Acidobacteria bacterium RIFCSPLOWO2_12_FULL_65_11]|nr:MAG: hypothetical protein A3H95_10935 [Acidobacteria bacterium RIFCSPLOWO2_02_FULL_64_15]OFW31351.1 MAG: hypothetical protein A3G76_13170 [Acidobacteria bacterium RIFCSPLOWO2_12_FULL_65_11]
MSSEKPRIPAIPARVSERYAAYRDLAISYEGFSDTILVRAPDISVSGMFINTAKIFPEGAVVKVRFNLSRTMHQVHARAEVRYCLPGVGIGIEFVEISDADRMAIQDELASEGPLPRVP